MQTICMFCTRRGMFNIHNEGRNHHTIKDDMIEFFGYKIEDHLRAEDVICKLCKHLMKNLAALKRCLLPLIYRNDNGRVKPPNLGKRWDIFASLSFSDECSDNTRTPTPTDLLTLTKVVPYNSREQRVSENDWYRSRSRASSTRSEVDSEVADVFSRRSRRRTQNTTKNGKIKKRRGKGWTRPKSGRYSRAVDVSSPMSVRSIKSTLSQYNNSHNNNSSRPTSAVTPNTFDTKVNAIPLKIYRCRCQNCDYFSFDLDQLNEHKISKHRALPSFYCNFCESKYTCKEDLKVHESTHIEYKCIICGTIYPSEDELRVHHQQHVENAVPCNICGRRFVDKKALIRHRTYTHMRRNHPNRIDYQHAKQKENNTLVLNPVKINNNLAYEARILVQEGDERDIEC